MAVAKVAQKGPFVVKESKGKKQWCSCGESRRQPYCDGSHLGGDFLPELVFIEAEKEVAWCGCKQTKTPPYCDGSHHSLPLAP